jgi:Serine aminopeptidase, S33
MYREFVCAFLLSLICTTQSLLLIKPIKSNIMGCSASKQEFDDDMYLRPIEGVTLEEKIVELNGRKINVSNWSPASPKAIILISHGLHEHGLRYFSVAASLTAKNFAVVAMDHSSHGLSEGTRGLITDYTALPQDFSALAASLHKESPQLPFFILAHSMGTLVASLAIKDLPFVKVRTNDYLINLAYFSCLIFSQWTSIVKSFLTIIFNMLSCSCALYHEVMSMTCNHDDSLRAMCKLKKQSN